ncbi:MAG: arabinan endo-1,5-alpha-L-arabinosidase [bacterium]
MTVRHLPAFSIPTIFLLFLVASPSLAVQPNATRDVHDPAIIKQGDTYYLFSTGTGIPIRRSKNLVHWEIVGQVFDPFPEWASREVPGVGHLWAPDISFFGGEYRLYYSVSTFGSNCSVIALGTNKTLNPNDPTYCWQDRGKVIESHPGEDDWNAIDPNAAFDADGNLWLSFGSFWSGIKLVRLDPGTGKLDPSHPELYSIARRLDPPSIEAPFIIRKNNFYYLFVSFDQCCAGVDSTYKTMVGRAEKITGPYTDRQGVPMMEGGATLLLASYDHIRGPGHVAVLSDGRTDWLVHHFYDATADGARTLQIRPLIWADDGWPLAGEPYTGPSASCDPPITSTLVGLWNHSVDFGPSVPTRFHPNGKIGDLPSSITWSLSATKLSLRWPRADAPGGVWLDDCYFSPDGKSYVGRNQNGMVIRGHKIGE